jgi:hypothetical protein
MISLTREDWDYCRQHQECLGFFVVSGSGLQNNNCSVMSPLQNYLLYTRSWAFPVMLVDSPSWMVKKSASLMLTIACDSAPWDVPCTSIRKLTLSNSRTFKVYFSSSSPNIIFILLQHIYKITNSGILCDFIFFLPWFRQRNSLLLELFQKLVVILVYWLVWIVWSAIGLLKYSNCFLHKCELFVWMFLFIFLGIIAWFVSFSPQTTHLGLGCSSPHQMNPMDM